MYETRTKLFIVNKDEAIIRNICDDLNREVKNILRLDANFIYYGSREVGYYTVINKNRKHKNNYFHLDFRLYYPDKAYYSAKEYNLKSIDNNTYFEEAFDQSNLVYVYIQWMAVEPQGRGKGSLIVKCLLELLKTIKSLEFVLLHPIDEEASNFWAKNNFIDEGTCTKLDKRIKKDACNRLIYKLNK